MRHSEKRRKTRSLIVLVLEIIMVIVMHAIKINKTAAAAGPLPTAAGQLPANVQQFPTGHDLLVIPKSSRHVSF
jgi:hypothetical protein